MSSPHSGNMKLADQSKFALALQSYGNGDTQSAPGSPRTPGSRGGQRRRTELSRRLRTTSKLTKSNLARDNAQELSSIRSVEDVVIDYDHTMGIKRGDLGAIRGEVYRCFPKAPHLSEIPLILKRMECVNRQIYELKVYEADTFQRFQGHANIVSLYSFWPEPPRDPYSYKTLVLLEEEGVLGDMNTTVVQSETRPSNRLALKWCCDITKGLIAVHNCNIVHGGVKPSKIYLDANKNAMVGEFGKVQLDFARQTHEYFSKALIGQAIPQTLVFWAPELLRLERYGRPADMWALGVSLYQIVTGMHPFNTQDENQFREDVLSANVDMSPLEGHSRLAIIIENLLRVDPDERWTAHQVLAFAQQEFAVEVQRVWRGHQSRMFYNYVRSSVVKIQSHVRGFITYVNYWRDRAVRREGAAVQLQKSFRGYRDRRDFQAVRDMFMRCQANVLAAQCRKSYLKYRADVVRCQSLVRRFLVLRWFDRVRQSRAVLENKLRTIQSMVLKFNDDAAEFAEFFYERNLPASLRYLQSFEQYELSLPEEFTHSLPELRGMHNRVTDLESEIERQNLELADVDEKHQGEQQEEEELKLSLGVKYPEFKPMVSALKKNLKRVAEQCMSASYLPVKVQHAYTYSKWDMVHEPHNVVENVLDDSESVWRTVSPAIDLTLCGGNVCFVSQVEIVPGESPPANIEIYSSHVPDKWTLVSSHKASSRDPELVFQLPGEQLCKYLRVKCLNNVRGGNIVAVRQVKVKGLVQKDENVMRR